MRKQGTFGALQGNVQICIVVGVYKGAAVMFKAESYGTWQPTYFLHRFSFGQLIIFNITQKSVTRHFLMNNDHIRFLHPTAMQ